MLINDYAKLLLIGWRRSGSYFYKPTNHLTCCPAYTIRLNVAAFTETKSQRQILRRVERFLETGNVLAKPDAIPPPAASAVTSSNTASSSAQCKENGVIHSATTADNAHQSTAMTDTGSREADKNARSFLSVETVPAEFTAERFELYKKYQIAVHKDDPESLKEKSFTRFLVQSPLTAGARGTSQSSTPETQPQWGTFHQLYRLNGRLVAVGVVDQLPIGLSSVYFFYDPNERHLVLGKYSALKEISYCREHNLEYYYMGYYIHSCDKMRYKAEYLPSELLCPSSHKWYPVGDATKLINAHKFTPLDPELATQRSLLQESPQVHCRTQVSIEPSMMDERQMSAQKDEKNQPNTETPGQMDEKSSKASGAANGASEGSSGEDEGGDDSDSTSIRDELSHSYLKEFAPSFPRRKSFSLAKIALDLGFGVPVSSSQLTVEGKKIVEEVLAELTQVCGQETASSFCIEFS